MNHDRGEQVCEKIVTTRKTRKQYLSTMSSHSNRMAIGVLGSFGMGSLSKHHSFLSRSARGIQSVDTVFPKVCKVGSHPLASAGQAFAGNPA
jgi:hypothetical protein